MQSIQSVRVEKLQDSALDVINIRNQFCEALISLQGGQILKFFSKKQNKDLLWLSECNDYQQEKAIRGGIPFCFPWFANHPTASTYPSHGFARNLLWKCLEIREDEMGHHLVLELKDNLQTRQYWDYAFVLHMTIHCGAELKLEMKLMNLDTQSFQFTFAWHSYFSIQTQMAQIHGLAQENYIDKVNQNVVKTQREDVITFNTEVDYIYPKTKGNFCLMDHQEHSIKIESNAKSAVVWNPWIEKSEKLKDIKNDDWQHFVCLECGQLDSEIIELCAGDHIQFDLKIYTA